YRGPHLSGSGRGRGPGGAASPSEGGLHRNGKGSGGRHHSSSRPPVLFCTFEKPGPAGLPFHRLHRLDGGAGGEGSVATFGAAAPPGGPGNRRLRGRPGGGGVHR